MYSSLLYGTKDFLISTLKYNGDSINDAICDVTIDGRPPANCGNLFIAVHPGGFRGTSMEILDGQYQVEVTISLRVTDAPFDRIGMFKLIDQKLGLGPLVQDIVQKVHMNYKILTTANSYITDFRNKWIEPLRLNVCSPPRYVSGEWFHSDGNATEEGIIQTISFADARRVQFTDYQPIPEMLDGYVPPEIADEPTIDVYEP